MFRLFSILLVGLVLSGCQQTTRIANDTRICEKAAYAGKWDMSYRNRHNVAEARRRGLSCGVGETTQTASAPVPSDAFVSFSDAALCNLATLAGKWETRHFYKRHIKEAKRRGLSCGVGETTQTASAPVPSDAFVSFSDAALCNLATLAGKWETRHFYKRHIKEAKRRGLSCGVGKASTNQIASKTRNQFFFTNMDNSYICMIAKNGVSWSKTHPKYVKEAKRRGLSCGVGGTTQIASVPKAKPKVTSAALTAAEKEAERLRQRVAALEAKQKQQQQTISNDTKLPTITIASVNTKGKQGIVKGRVNDNTGIAEVTVDGTVVPVTNSGDFEYSTFVPSGGLSLKVQATDLAGLTSMMSVTLERNAGTATAAINFDRLNPTMGKRVKVNKDALALIVGVADYENTPAKAVFADSDAMMFRDYASEKLGIPESRIKTLVNDGADERELLLSVKSWLARASKQGKSDVYVFFAGHGLASDNGEKMYLLPYDGSPELLDDTAILRDRLFSDIASANPRSVTVFLDTCYSGTTRGTDMLIASRPIAIKALEQSIPDNFTVMTAARGDQTAKPLEEAKHGMFSYFLMKGMEGEADQNSDNKITSGELHQYVQQNVVQQSSGSQTPELQGDANRVLVRFQ